MKRLVATIDNSIQSRSDFVVLTWLRLRHAVWRRQNGLPPKHSFGILRRGSTAYVVDSASGKVIFLPDVRRGFLYSRGIEFRQESLASSYCIDKGLMKRICKAKSSEYVIDIGAHAGEVGILLRQRGFQGRYIAVEPDPNCIEALRLNADRSSFVVAQAASDENKVLEFTLATSSGDSGFHSQRMSATKTTVRAQTLDSMLQELLGDSPTRIALLKVEAEGHEPEVLSGAAKTLQATSFLAIDFGPERDGQWTDQECVVILESAGFTQVRRENTRAMYVNSRLALGTGGTANTV